MDDPSSTIVFASWAVTNYAIYVLYSLNDVSSGAALIQIKRVADREPYNMDQYSVSFDVDKRKLQWHLNGNVLYTLRKTGEKDTSLHTIMEQPAAGGAFDDVDDDVRPHPYLVFRYKGRLHTVYPQTGASLRERY